MKIIKRILAALALCTVAITTTQAQEPVLTLKAPGTVTAGQPFDVQYAINVRGSKKFQAPPFKGLDVLYGPAQSQSSSFSFVNGHQTQSFTLSFTYRLSAPKEGTYSFGKASIEVDGKTYYSEPFTLTVQAAPAGGTKYNSSHPYASGTGSTSAYATSATASSSGADPGSPKEPTLSDNDLYIRALPSKRNPYVGEQILLTYRIYTAVPVEQYSIYKTPSNKGFWTEELKVNPQNQQQEIINNKTYVRADMRKIALFAQESGKLKLDPMEVEAVAEVQSRSRRRSRSFFDMFDDDFFTPTQMVKKTLSTDAVNITVKPLPLEGRPLSFDGLVGEYNINFDYNKAQKFKTNEAITLTFTVSGKGNIEMIHAPQIQFPPDFEVYEPKVTHDKNVGENGISGNATFEYLVVPRNPGAYKIPSFDYSFFNPATGRYVEKHIDEIVLDIAPGKDMPAAGVHGSNAAGGSHGDIAYIQTGMANWKKAGRSFLFSLRFWMWLLAEAAVFALILFVLKRNAALKADVAGMKNRKAARAAKKCLRKALRFLDEGKREAFHIEISQALWGFLSDKLSIPTAELSMDNVRGKLSERALETALIEQFIKALENCEFARFAPGEPDGADMQRLYDQALDAVYTMAATLK